MQVYRRHPRKAVADSYTPQTLKLQIALVYLILLTLPLAARWPLLAGVAALMAAALAGSMLPLTRMAWRRDRRIAPLVPWFLCVRGLAIGAGSLLGTLTALRVLPLLAPTRPIHEQPHPRQ
jgi:hypothetical protein